MAERQEPRVPRKSPSGPAPGSSLTRNYKGLPTWAWLGVGAMTLTVGYLFVKRYRAAKAAKAGTTGGGPTALDPSGYTAPLASGGAGLPPGMTPAPTPPAAGNPSTLPVWQLPSGTQVPSAPGSTVASVITKQLPADSQGGMTTLFSAPTTVNSYTPGPGGSVPAYVGADQSVPPVYIGPYTPSLGGFIDSKTLQPTTQNTGPGVTLLGPGALATLTKLGAHP